MIQISKSKWNVLSDKTNVKTWSRSSNVWQYVVRQPNSNYAICSLCTDKKRISANNGSTSTLRQHLILKHNIRELILPNRPEKRTHSSSSINISRKQQLHELLIRWYDPPNRYLVVRRLKRFHVIPQKKLIDDLASIDNISITMGLWSNRQMRCFLVITEAKLKELNISQKVVCVTCDGDMPVGANGENEDMINLEEFQDNDETDMDIMSELEFDDNESMEVEVGDCNHEDEEELLSSVIDDEIVDNWTEDAIESDVDIVHDQELIVNLFKKCRGFISMIKRSTILTLFFDNERKKLSIKRNLCYDIKSLWNTGFELTTDDWVILAQLHLVLKPFFHATKAISGRRYPSIGLAFYLITRLKEFLQHHERKQNLMIKRLKQLLLVKLLFCFERDHEQPELLK
ncbi:unnamed protein product, partial [Rotaria magnacalcarata]